MASLLGYFLNIRPILISTGQILSLIHSFCFSMMLACTWLLLGNKLTASSMLPITDRLLEANTSNSQRANSTLVPREATDWLSLGEVGITVPVCHGRGTRCIISSWPPILTSSPEALLRVISREGLELTSIQTICIIFC